MTSARWSSVCVGAGIAIGLTATACSSNGDETDTPHVIIVKSAGDTQTVIAGLPVPISPTVVVTSDGTPAAGDTVVFAIADQVPGPGGGAVTGATPVTDANGFAAVGAWIPGVAGQHMLTATVRGISASKVTFTATATSYSVVVHPIIGTDHQNAVAGTSVALPPEVLVEEVSQTEGLVPVVGATVTFVVGEGGGSVTGPVATTDSAGMASVGSWTLGATPGTNTLEVVVSPLPDPQFTFNATGTQ